MVTIAITYHGDLRCESTHAPSGTTLLTDAPVDNQGKGASFSPTDLVATALGTCMLTVMGIAARKHGIAMEGATAVVEKTMVASPTRRVGSLKTVITMPRKLDDAQRQLLETAALTCPVKQSLHPDVALVVEFVWP